MSIFTIADGREAFWQWDKGQRLNIDMTDPRVLGKTVTEINFSNASTAGSIRCAVNVGDDGVYSVSVPNTFFLTGADLLIYAVFVGENEFRTEIREKITVYKRPKPNGYVYTETLGVTDKTLSMSGIAADALATGEAINNLSEQLGASIEEANKQAEKAYAKAEEVESNVVETVLPAVEALVAGYGDAIDALKENQKALYKGVVNNQTAIENNYNNIATMQQQIADILYEPMAINSFKATPSTAEIGSTVNTITLDWTLNKIPIVLTVDGEAVDVESEGMGLANVGITANKTWTLAATDERGATASKTASLTFLNGVYYGVADVSKTIDSAFILGLTKELRSSKKPSISVNAGAGQYIYYCVPTRFGTCSFTVGGFSGGFSLVATIEFTNASGYAENYYVYRSDNAGLGSTAVTIA